jgi:hypothetical protein
MTSLRKADASRPSRWVVAQKTTRSRAALNYFAYNFVKIHRTLRMSLAMAAGVSDRLEVRDLVALWKPMSSGGQKRAVA